MTLPPFAGVDPFDALRGSRVPGFVRNNARLRQIAIQLRKRLPFDLAPLLGVKPFEMAKTLGANLTAESRSAAVGEPSAAQAAAELIGRLLDAEDIARLGEGRWGYEFDVQTRWAYYPAGSPNLIATYFVGRGFAEAAAAGIDERAFECALRCARYLDGELRRETGWYAYTADASVLVHNANLFGAGFVAAMGRLTNDDALVSHALAAADVTVAAQAADGSWAYGDAPNLAWIDNFHTAYNLEGLLLVWLATGEERMRVSLERGLAFWLEELFEADGAPRYYAAPGAAHPYDIHSAATAIDVAARLATWGFDTAPLVRATDAWTRKNLIAPDGTSYYQKHAGWTDRRHFARWGDAHWALAQSSRRLLEAGVHSPLEERLATERAS